MDIIFRTCTNLDKAAGITFENMRPYYQEFAPDWDKSKVLAVTSTLDNYDIVLDNEVVGVMRLQFNEQYFLRDLQIAEGYKNCGIGKLALDEAKRLAKLAQGTLLQLRVLKVSPAIALYERNGFIAESEDERFINMVVKL
jgi:ribosomal protein S18 acetylase RimI-like enzyme